MASPIFSILICTARGDLIETKRMSYDRARRAYDSLEPNRDGCLARVELHQRGAAIFKKERKLGA
jgi:hypothetical protein